MSSFSVGLLVISESLQSNYGFMILGSVLLTIVLYRYTTTTDISRIKHIPEIPGAIPLFGHLLQLGDDHATVCEAWWRKYHQPVFQIKLGNTRAVVVNSFDNVKQMLVGHQSAVIDRPTLYTFHGVISSTQGFTIGSSPWDESCKNRRKAAGATLGRASIKNYHDMYDLESFCILRDLYRDSHNGTLELDVRPYIQRYALNTTLTLCYGIRMDNVYDNMLREILHVGSAISLLRSASENYQDYVPMLRWWPNNEKNRRSKELRGRRDKYLNDLLAKVQHMVQQGTDKPCIAAAIMKDTESKLNDVEVGSICLSLVSGGFETIPGTLTSCIGSLSTPEGQIFQQRAYDDIIAHYGSPTNAENLDKLWTSSISEETSPYINAIVKEAARYYTVSAMSLPRKTITEIRWKQPDRSIAIIPPKTMILINAQAANHDIDHFGPDGGIFNPERWLVPSSSSSSSSSPVLSNEKQQQHSSKGSWTELPSTGIPHFSFGAGSRACSGQIIAQRLLYTALVRLLSCYKVVASVESPPNTDYVEYNAIKTALVAIPREFRVRLVPREGVDVDGVVKRWEGRTRGFYA